MYTMNHKMSKITGITLLKGPKLNSCNIDTIIKLKRSRHDLSSKLKILFFHFQCLEWLIWVIVMLCQKLQPRYMV